MDEKKKLYKFDYEEKDLFNVIFDAKFPIQCFFEGLSLSKIQRDREVAEIGFALLRDFSEQISAIDKGIEKHLGKLEFHVYKMNEVEEAEGIVEPYELPSFLGVILRGKEKTKAA